MSTGSDEFFSSPIKISTCDSSQYSGGFAVKIGDGLLESGKIDILGNIGSPINIASGFGNANGGQTFMTSSSNLHVETAASDSENSKVFITTAASSLSSGCCSFINWSKF